MRLHTASEVISFVRKLEGESANFYEALSQKYGKDEDVLLSFAKDDRKNLLQIERTYYSVITDAIEGGFAFNIETDEYTFDTTLAENAKYPDALDKATEIEEKILKFYADAAEQSRALMADIPRAFTMVAKKRGGRRPRLELIAEVSRRS